LAHLTFAKFVLSGTLDEGAVASQSNGSAARCMCFEPDCEPPDLGRGGTLRAEELMSRPKVRAALVNARGRFFVFNVFSSFSCEGAKANAGLGGGDMSMKSARSLSGVSAEVL